MDIAIDINSYGSGDFQTGSPVRRSEPPLWKIIMWCVHGMDVHKKKCKAFVSISYIFFKIPNLEII